MKHKNILILLVLTTFLVACATGGFDSAKKTSQLDRGMSYKEVVSLLGEPQSSSMKDGKLLATFALHQSWKGNVVYDMTFNANSRLLEEWSENEEQYLQNQMQLGQITSAISSPSNTGSGDVSAPAGPNDAVLQKQIAGTWWGYSGSTERKLGLCADGRYRDYTEASYSGRSSDSGGNETMAWGSGSQGSNTGNWTINGDTQSGTISVTYSGGRSSSIRYRQVGEPGCLDINGARLCRTSASCD